MMEFIRLGRWPMLMMLAVMVAASCRRLGSPSDFDQYKQLQRTPLRALGTLYGQYMSRHGGRTPATDEEFEKYLKNIGRRGLDELGVQEIDSLFVSPRDGAPMVVLYGKNIGPRGTSDMPWVAYEQRSTAGSRYVVGAAGVVVVMDDEEFHELFPAVP